ncbi:MAG TPA: response regulator, partial [Dongiaceae bacterium]|nr:response regulator [Dongiaceae bacterium]
MSAATELRRSAEERLQVKAAKLHPPRTREETQRLVHERPLRLLLIEDSEDDALLLVLELRQGGFDLDFARVDAPQALEATLDGNTWDAVIADYNMPAFSGLDALRIIQAKGLDLPFILVSGVVGEAMAVEAMKAGAHDFIMKGNFSRLAPALERELQEAEVRQERRQAVGELHRSHEGLELGIRQRTAELARTNEVLRAEISEHKRTENELRASEEKFATMFRAVPIAMALATSSDGALYDVNPAWLDLAGFARKEEVIGKTSLELGLIGDAAQRECILNEFRQNGFARNVELTFSTRKGIQRTVLVNLDSVEIGGSAFILSTMEEITERKRAEDALRESMSREQERAAELATLLDTVPTPVFVAHDIECLHITGNRAADELLYIPRGAEASLSA